MNIDNLLQILQDFSTVQKKYKTEEEQLVFYLKLKDQFSKEILKLPKDHDQIITIREQIANIDQELSHINRLSKFKLKFYETIQPKIQQLNQNFNLLEEKFQIKIKGKKKKDNTMDKLQDYIKLLNEI